jgi:hypothetical protein
MENILEFETFNPQTAGSAPAGAEVAPPVLGTINFTMSGVSDDVIKLIAGLMAQSMLASGEAEKIARMADTDPKSAASYLQKKVEGILAESPGLTPSYIQEVPGLTSAFIQSMRSQSANVSKMMVQTIPELFGNLTDKDIEANSLKPDTSKASFLSKLS